MAECVYLAKDINLQIQNVPQVTQLTNPKKPCSETHDQTSKYDRQWKLSLKRTAVIIDSLMGTMTQDTVHFPSETMETTKGANFGGTKKKQPLSQNCY